MLCFVLIISVILNLVCVSILSPPERLCITMNCGESHLSVSLVAGGKVVKTVSINHNV